MKKFLIVVVIIILVLVTCKSCNKTNTNAKTEYSMIVNDGSMFVYTFKDPLTGVWYISNAVGITPRLNNDGSLFTE